MTPPRTYSLRYALIILATIVLTRLVTLGMPDLIDTTEGRYATTAQLMLERGDWVTPWIIFKGVEKPYLGKPPLHFWLMNGSYLTLGLTNFAARLPSFISAVAIAFALYFLVARIADRRAALASLFILSTSAFFFFLSGGCVLDVTLTVGVTLAIVGFSLADRSRWNGALCFVGLGLGVLVKGPAAIVFFGMAVGPWALLRRMTTGTWPQQIRSLPWITGLALFLAISIPWYLIAESHNPGFLKYFIWNENLGRFFSKDYGDEYGVGHKQVRGAAWVMLFVAVIPWSLIALAEVCRHRKILSLKRSVTAIISDPWLTLGFTWTISCPLLLIFARQYTPTYIFSSLPGFALFAALLWRRYCDGAHTMSTRIAQCTSALFALTLLTSAIAFHTRTPSLSAVLGGVLISAVALGLSLRLKPTEDPLRLVGGVSLCTALTFGGLVWAATPHLSQQRSTRAVVEYAAGLIKKDQLSIGFAYNLPFSARFYSARIPGQKVTVSQVNESNLLNPREDLIIVRGPSGDDALRALDPNKEKIGQLGRWSVYRGAK